ncbi:hypothetical protein HMPREF9248_0067 [Fannyhessea vaginae PB189-T1-4]|uniref:Uncharacterized protein n=1 Tax=Fannyhessea vaginae PB189-T1-4 TaxID=866774 RepID=A0ABP2IX86_9ACTN|nr:hypothetical protein HMPREF9248_0067 [Fannyhessea vaginae PB189-T1-4]
MPVLYIHAFMDATCKNAAAYKLTCFIEQRYYRVILALHT